MKSRVIKSALLVAVAALFFVAVSGASASDTHSITPVSFCEAARNGQAIQGARVRLVAIYVPNRRGAFLKDAKCPSEAIAVFFPPQWEPPNISRFGAATYANPSSAFVVTVIGTISWSNTRSPSNYIGIDDIASFKKTKLPRALQ